MASFENFTQDVRRALPDNQSSYIDRLDTYSSMMASSEALMLRLLNNADTTKSPLMEKLTYLRMKAIECTRLQEYTDLYYEAWEYLSNSAIDLSLQFPKKYPTDTTCVLETLLQPVFSMKRYFRGEAGSGFIGSGSCQLLYGPKGIGKTTILAAFYCLVLLLTDHVVPVYWSYDNRNCQALDTMPTPRQLLLRRSQTLGLVESDCTEEQVLTKLSDEKKKFIVVLADEIQELYEGASNNLPSLHGRKVTVIAELAAIGKSRFAVSYLAGSSVNTCDYSLHPKEFGFPDYQELNGSVFSKRLIKPIRQQASFCSMAKIILDRYGGTTADEEHSYQRMFLQSGGVGRLMEAVNIRNIRSEVEDCWPPLPIEYYEVENHPALRFILNEMFSLVKDHIDSKQFNPWKHPHHLGLDRVLQIIQKCSAKSQHPYNILSNYCDKNILYIDESRGIVEALRPGIFCMLHSLLGTKSVGTYEAMAFEGVLCGWSSSPSSTTFPSASHCAEPVLLEQCVRCRYFDLWNDDLGDITYDRQLPEVSPSPKSLDPLSVQNQIRQSVSTFVGLDGLALQVDDENKVILLYVAQIKLGRLDRSVRVAELCGWLKAALIGIKKAMNMLQIADGFKVRVPQLLIITSRPVDQQTATAAINQEAIKHDDQQIRVRIIERGEVLEDLQDDELRTRLLPRQ